MIKRFGSGRRLRENPWRRSKAIPVWVNSVAFDPKGERLVSGSYDKSILLWQSIRTDGRKWQVQYRLAAAWSLLALGAFLQGATLSPQNKALLLQRNAKDEAPYPSSFLGKLRFRGKRASIYAVLVTRR